MKTVMPSRPVAPQRHLAAVTAAILLGMTWSGSAVAAQSADLSVEVGGSSISPPAGLAGEDARFFVAGVRALRFNMEGSGVLGSFLWGRTLTEEAGGDFLSGALEATAMKYMGGGWSAGLEAKGFGFKVEDPFPYRSVGAEGGPTLRYTGQHLYLNVKGIGGGGWSRTELRRTGGPVVSVVEDELWRYGGTGELLAGARGILGGFALGIHESTGGTYRSAGLRVLATGWGGAALELRVDTWDTPAGNQTTGGLALVVPLGGWSVRGFLGRTEPDPLTLAEPGGGAGGLLVGRRLWGRDPLPPPKPPLHRIVESNATGSLVEIRVKAPRGTTSMEVMGDFTLWEPVPMVRDGEEWTTRLEIPFGTHHFGFLANDEWFLPDDAPNAVPDEWGRRNATIAIER
jgi:hypothetical protein